MRTVQAPRDVAEERGAVTNTHFQLDSGHLTVSECVVAIASSLLLSGEKSN